MTKKESISPKVTDKGLILLLIINATDKRDVATTNAPGAFFHTDMDGTVQVSLDGVLAEIILKIYPEKYRVKLTLIGGRKLSMWS